VLDGPTRKQSSKALSRYEGSYFGFATTPSCPLHVAVLNFRVSVSGRRNDFILVKSSVPS
jgi:hypothetical protein